MVSELYKKIKKQAHIEIITEKMPWNFETDIGHLQYAISCLQEAARKSEWVDDGSGKEYADEQYEKADKNRQAAIEEIESAMTHILDVV